MGDKDAVGECWEPLPVMGALRVYERPAASQVAFRLAVSGPPDCGLKTTPILQSPPPATMKRPGAQALLAGVDREKLDASGPDMVVEV